MMAEALERWLRDEMEMPPSAVPSPAVLRRLCSGPTAPVWDFVTRHVRNPRNVKKIQGNLRLYPKIWGLPKNLKAAGIRYGYLQELEPLAQGAAAPPSRQGELRAAVARLRNELQSLEDAMVGAEEEAQRLEASLAAMQSRRWAALRQGAELRLLAAEASSDWLRAGHQGALKGPQKRPGQSRAELAAILASGAEPEVLVSIKALCKAREAELQRPRPPRDAQKETQDWQQQAEAVLSAHSPEAVLWALEVLANQSTRALLASPAPSPEAPPTLKRHIQEGWWAVGGMWAELPPLLAQLAQLRQRLQHLEAQLGPEGSTARLLLARAGLRGFLGSLNRALQEPPKSPKSDPQSPKSDPQSPKSDPKSGPKPPKSPEVAPQSSLGRLLRRLRRRRARVSQLQQRLRFLRTATRGRRARLRALQEQVVGVARAGLGSAPTLLEGEGQRRRGLELGALGEPLPHSATPHPLWKMGRELGGHQGALLSRAAILKQQLRQGALRARRGAGPALGAGPEAEVTSPPLPPAEGEAELLPQLRLVSTSCRQRIRDWPRLQGLVNQWWSQPAQWTLATPPGHAPFSHWLQRWREAAGALQATPTPLGSTPTPLGATPTEGEE